jgi:3-keto-5-aminohexanoate cleavage enzyme
MEKLIINLCSTGMVPTKEMTPYVPITPDEIINNAIKCAELGVSIVHIHPRDENGKPTWKKEAFEKIIGGIKEKNDKLLISVTTSGRDWSEFEKRSECLEIKGDLKPDLASLTVGSMNFISTASVNNPQMIEDLATKMKDNGIKPELEIFEPGMIHKAKYLIKKGIIDGTKPYFNILYGSLGTSPLEPSIIAAMHPLLPENSVWSMAGIGNYQLDANILGMSLGGHVRVGLEDNIFFDREKVKLASNEELVERIVEVSKLLQREIATPEETRQIIGL